jgi:hypothetical protein
MIWCQYKEHTPRGAAPQRGTERPQYEARKRANILKIKIE